MADSIWVLLKHPFLMSTATIPTNRAYRNASNLHRKVLKIKVTAILEHDFLFDFYRCSARNYAGVPPAGQKKCPAIPPLPAPACLPNVSPSFCLDPCITTETRKIARFPMSLRVSHCEKNAKPSRAGYNLLDHCSLQASLPLREQVTGLLLPWERSERRQ